MKANGYQVALAELAVRTGPQQASVAISMAGWKRPRDPGDGVPKYLGARVAGSPRLRLQLAASRHRSSGGWRGLVADGSHPEKARHQVQGLT